MFQQIFGQISEQGAKSAQAFKGVADTFQTRSAKMNPSSAVGQMQKTDAGTAPASTGAAKVEPTKAEEKPLETEDSKVDTPDTKVETEEPKEAPAPPPEAPTMSHETNPFIKKPME